MSQVVDQEVVIAALPAAPTVDRQVSGNFYSDYSSRDSINQSFQRNSVQSDLQDDCNSEVIRIIQKPTDPTSNYVSVVEYKDGLMMKKVVSHTVEEFNGQNAVLKATDPRFLWQNKVNTWFRLMNLFIIWFAFILQLTENGFRLDGGSWVTRVEGLDDVDVIKFADDAENNALIVNGLVASGLLLSSVYAQWKPSLHFQPILSFFDVVSFGLLIWTTTVFGSLSHWVAYKSLAAFASYNLIVLSMVCSIHLFFLTTTINFFKFIQRDDIENKRKLALKGNLPISKITTNEAFHSQYKPFRITALYLRLAIVLLSGAVICLLLAQRVWIKNSINSIFLFLTAYDAAMNLVTCAGVVCGVSVGVLVLDLMGFSWVGALVDIFFMSCWITFVGDYGANPQNGIYKYASTLYGPIPSIKQFALTFEIPQFSGFFVGILLLTSMIITLHAICFFCGLKIKIGRIMFENDKPEEIEK